MFLFVICFNVGLALFNLWLALQLLNYCQRLRRFSGYCRRLEQSSQGALRALPGELTQVTHYSQRVRGTYSLLQKRWDQFQKVLLLLRLSRMI